MTETPPALEAPAVGLVAPTYCGTCGKPEDVSATPDTAAACGQCGGPACAADVDVSVSDADGTSRTWKLCGHCALTVRGRFSDAAVLADVLAARYPGEPELSEAAFAVASRPAPEGAVAVPVGWTQLMRDVAGTGYYCAVAPYAPPGEAPRGRWQHLPDGAAQAARQAVLNASQMRTLVPSPSGAPCVMCGAGESFQGRWLEPVPGRPLCGTCRDLVGGVATPPAQLPPPGAQPEAARPLEPVVPEPPRQCGPCGQCGGLTFPGDLVVPMTDRNRQEVRWAICKTCATLRGLPDWDTRVLLDAIACLRPDDLQIQEQAAFLAQRPRVRGVPELKYGWRYYAERINGLHPYFFPHLNRQPTDQPGERWSHVPAHVTDRIAEDIRAQYVLRHAEPHPSGQPCIKCGRAREVPHRWSDGPLCGNCAEEAALRAKLAEHTPAAHLEEIQKAAADS